MSTAPAPTDREVIARFRAGDRSAFDQLYAEYQLRIAAFIRNRCPRRVDAESIIQETWLRAWKAHASFEDASFSGWVFTIARRLLYDATARVGNRVKVTSVEDWDIAEAITEDYSDEMDAMRQCMESVGREFAEVLKLQIEGKSTEEIMSLLGIAQNTVYSRRSRGIADVQACVKAKLG